MAVLRRVRPRGTTLVEMAIALPVFLLLVFGVIVIGSIYSHQMSINTAARDGARLAAVGHSYDEVLAQCRGITPNLNHDPARFGVAVQQNAQGVVCIVEYTEKIGVPVLSLLFNNKKLEARAEHVYETAWIER